MDAALAASLRADARAARGVDHAVDRLFAWFGDEYEDNDAMSLDGFNWIWRWFDQEPIEVPEWRAALATLATNRVDASATGLVSLEGFKELIGLLMPMQSDAIDEIEQSIVSIAQLLGFARLLLELFGVEDDTPSATSKFSKKRVGLVQLEHLHNDCGIDLVNNEQEWTSLLLVLGYSSSQPSLDAMEFADVCISWLKSRDLHNSIEEMTDNVLNSATTTTIDTSQIPAPPFTDPTPAFAHVVHHDRRADADASIDERSQVSARSSVASVNADASVEDGAGRQSLTSTVSEASGRSARPSFAALIAETFQRSARPSSVAMDGVPSPRSVRPSIVGAVEVSSDEDQRTGGDASIDDRSQVSARPSVASVNADASVEDGAGRQSLTSTVSEASGRSARPSFAALIAETFQRSARPSSVAMDGVPSPRSVRPSIVGAVEVSSDEDQRTGGDASIDERSQVSARSSVASVNADASVEDGAGRQSLTSTVSEASGRSARPSFAALIAETFQRSARPSSVAMDGVPSPRSVRPSIVGAVEVSSDEDQRTGGDASIDDRSQVSARPSVASVNADASVEDGAGRQSLTSTVSEASGRSARPSFAALIAETFQRSARPSSVAMDGVPSPRSVRPSIVGAVEVSSDEDQRTGGDASIDDRSQVSARPSVASVNADASVEDGAGRQSLTSTVSEASGRSARPSFAALIAETFQRSARPSSVAMDGVPSPRSVRPSIVGAVEVSSDEDQRTGGDASIDDRSQVSARPSVASVNADASVEDGAGRQSLTSTVSEASGRSARPSFAALIAETFQRSARPSSVAMDGVPSPRSVRPSIVGAVEVSSDEDQRTGGDASIDDRSQVSARPSVASVNADASVEDGAGRQSLTSTVSEASGRSARPSFAALIAETFQRSARPSSVAMDGVPSPRSVRPSSVGGVEVSGDEDQRSGDDESIDERSQVSARSCVTSESVDAPMGEGVRGQSFTTATATEIVGNTIDLSMHSKELLRGDAVDCHAFLNAKSELVQYALEFESDTNVGIDLRTAFHGRFLCVDKVQGTPDRLPMVQPHDILARVDGERLMWDIPSTSGAEDARRVAVGTAALSQKLPSCEKRVVHFRPESSHYKYDSQRRELSIRVIVMSETTSRARLVIYLPHTNFRWDDGEIIVATTPPSDWKVDTIDSVRDCPGFDVVVSGSSTISAKSAIDLVFKDLRGGGIDTSELLEVASENTSNPDTPHGEASDPDIENIQTYAVRSISDWNERDVILDSISSFHSALQQGSRASVMTAVESILLDVGPGKSGVTLASTVFDQCAVVDAEEGVNHAGIVQSGDILSSITGNSEGRRRTTFSCMKTSRMDSIVAEAHLHDLRDRLLQVEESQQPFQLHLLRLHCALSFSNDNKCLVTLSVPSALVCGMEIVLKLPKTQGKWSVEDNISATVCYPSSASVGPVEFDPDDQALIIELTFQDRQDSELTKTTMSVEGLLWTPKSKPEKPFADSVQFAGFIEGITYVIGEKLRISLSFFDHLHKLLHDVHASIKQAAVLVASGEHAAKIFQRFSREGFITFEGVNRLIRADIRDQVELLEEEWDRICYIVQADADVGLTLHQFASCWLEDNAERLINHLEMVESAFKMLCEISEMDSVDVPTKEHTLPIENLPRAMKVIGVPEDQATQLLVDLQERGVRGWDCDTFSQALCGTHPIIQIPNHGTMDAIVATKTQLETALKVFDEYSSHKHGMYKADYERFLMDSNSIKTTLTIEQWASICETVGERQSDVEEVVLSKANFVTVYVADKQHTLGAFADWVPLRELSVGAHAAEPRMQSAPSLDPSLDPEMNIALAPERVDISHVAKKVLEDTPTTDKAMKDMVGEGLEFAESDVTDEMILPEQFNFTATFEARLNCRKGGSLHIEIDRIVELADHIVKSNEGVDTEEASTPDDDALFVVLEVTDATGLNQYFATTNNEPATIRSRVGRFLFGKNRAINNASESIDNALGHRVSIARAEVVPDESGGALAEAVETQKQQGPYICQVRSSHVQTKSVIDSVLRFPERVFELILPVAGESEDVKPEYVVCRLFKRAAGAKSEFMGQASFKLDALLTVLDANDKVTEELRVLQSEKQADVGVLVVRFWYRCMETIAQEEPLASLQVKVENDDEFVPRGATTSESGFAYPADSSLIVEWKVEQSLSRGDRIYLVREGMPSKFTYPFFLTVWLSAVGEERNEWWVPRSCALSYSAARGINDSTAPGQDMPRVCYGSSNTSGVIVLPSSMGLGLPPGTYRLYLLRFAADASSKSRMILGRSSPLAVIPDVNGMHTCFGSTPLIDVRQLRASVQLYLDDPDQTHDQQFHVQTVDQVRGANNGSRDELRIKVELKVAERNLADAEKMAVGDRKLSHQRWIEKLQIAIEALKSELAQVNQDKAAQPHSEDRTVSLRRDSHPVKLLPTTSSTGQLSSGCNVSIRFQLDGGTPCPGDHIVVLPAEVVHTADLLRASILGKLQSNNPEELDSVRSSLETELTQVCRRMTGYQLRYRIWRLRGKVFFYALTLIPLSLLNGVGAVFTAKWLRGASKTRWVEEECEQQYEQASQIAKNYFPYIIRELLSEIRARRSDLGLVESMANADQGSLDMTLDVVSGCRHQVIDVPIPPVAVVKLAVAPTSNSSEAEGAPKLRAPRSPQRSARVINLRSSNQPVDLQSGAGVIVAELDNQIFWKGGEYIVKYVRRLPANGALSSNLTAGELGRFGPFVVNPFPIDDFDAEVITRKALTQLRRLGTSQEARLLYRIGILIFLSLIKYSLVVLSLSFNIKIVALSVGLSFEEVEELIEKFRNQLNAAMLNLFLWFRLDELMAGFKRLWELFQFRYFTVHFECATGFLLYIFLAMLFGAMLLMYIVVRADVLLKVQQWHTVLGVRLGKTAQGFSEQIGTLLVIPVYLVIKSIVLYIAEALHDFTVRTKGKKSSQTLASLKLYTTATETCPNVHFARLNTIIGFIALMMIIVFIFICVPLVVLELFSWAPLPLPRKMKLEQTKLMKKQQKAKKNTREEIQAAIVREETLVEWDSISRLMRHINSLMYRSWQAVRDAVQKRAGPLVPARLTSMALPRVPFSDKLKPVLTSLSDLIYRFSRHPMFDDFDNIYYDFYTCSREELADKYGFIGGMGVVRRVYQHLMVQTIKRGLGDLAGLRPSHKDMYDSRRVQPKSKKRWLQIDRPCAWFNIWWKYEYVRHRIVIPLLNVSAITFGYWGVQQWTTFQVETRANEGFPMDPSGESRQLQLMALQGKIVSLFWLCFPRTSILSFLAELLNTGPVTGYLVNTKFLQADTLDTERVEAPAWRFHRRLGPKGETDVIYLIGNTQFAGTLTKWTSAFVQVLMLSIAFMVHNSGEKVLASIYKALLLAAGVPTALEFNQAAVAAYLDYVERVETSVDTLKPPSTSDGGASGGSGQLAAKDEKKSGSDAFKMKKELVRLNAMPFLSYVVLADQLGDGEGEVTISWQVNASQRYDALDAIGMFPVRAPDDKRERTMADCVCYQLLNETNAKPIGSMKDKAKGVESAEIDTNETKVTLQGLRPASATKEDSRPGEIQVMVSKTDDALSGGEEVGNDKITSTHEVATRSRALSHASAKGEASRRARRIVSGQVKFRPVNSSVDESDDSFERFKHGNSDGIYQAKYGLHAYEFCYLRYDKASQRLAKDASIRDFEANKKARKPTGTTDKPDQTVMPIGALDREGSVVDMDATAAATSGYEVTSFTSNPIRIGTFNLYMNLTCARSLMRTKERLDLSWTINGIPYSILSDPKSRNCIGFFKVSGNQTENSTADEPDQCTRIEILPPSAFLKPSDGQPCQGHATVTTPSEPGVYEVRFLVNYFKDAQLHRRCQDFGDLEDKMQELRIRSVHEKRLLADALGALESRAARAWRDAAYYTHLWFAAMLQSSLRELECASDNVVNKITPAQARAFLVERLEQNLEAALREPSELDANVLARLVAPLQERSFTDVVIAAFNSSSQLEDQLAAVTFASPTDEDKQLRKEMKGDETAVGFRERYSIFVPQSDRPLIQFGAVAFVPLAESYLDNASLCGFYDFMDDILLNHEQLMVNYEHVVASLADSCVSLYDEPVARAIDEAIKSFPKLATTIRGAQAAVTLACLNHVQIIVSAFLLTDTRNGRRWHGPFKDAMTKMDKLRRGRLTKTVSVERYQIDISVDVNDKANDVGRAPFTPGYVALREWAYPRLLEKIVGLLQVRHSRRAGSNLRVAEQMLRKFKWWGSVRADLGLGERRLFPSLEFSTTAYALDFALSSKETQNTEALAASSPSKTSHLQPTLRS